MPRLRKREIPFERVKQLLLGYGVNGPMLARVLNCSEKTARSRLNNPETFTLAELGAISRKTSIPIDELRGAIR